MGTALYMIQINSAKYTCVSSEVPVSYSLRCFLQSISKTQGKNSTIKIKIILYLQIFLKYWDSHILCFGFCVGVGYPFGSLYSTPDQL